MKLNLKVRLRNPICYLTVIPAVIAFVYTVLGCFGVVPTISESTVTNVFTAVITFLTALGVLIDPTTKGVGDSEKALHYCKPGECGKENEESANEKSEAEKEESSELAEKPDEGTDNDNSPTE